MRPSCARNIRPKNRGRGECRVPVAPAASRVEKNTRVRHHRFAGTPDIPCAMVLTVSFVLLCPVTGLCCHRRRRSLPRRLERLRRGVRTTRLRRPQARALVRSAVHVHRIPLRVRDDRETPLRGRGTAWDMRLIWVGRETKNFCEGGWTGPSPDSPSGKSPESNDKCQQLSSLLSH
jgi:hypothetical protein